MELLNKTQGNLFLCLKILKSVMLLNLIELINRLILSVSRYRKIKPKGEIVKVNIGSGLSVAPGWLNVDASLNAFFSKWPAFVLKLLYRISSVKKWYSIDDYLHILKNNTFIHYNVEYGLPFPDESVDYIYSSHLLEHLYKEDAKKLLKEAYRVLKKGGIIRICVPDLEYAISLYQKGEKEKALNYFFTTSKASYLSTHRYMYDFDLLKHLLEEVGFTNVKKCSFRQGMTPDIEILDNRPEETLYVEAIKAS